MHVFPRLATRVVPVLWLLALAGCPESGGGRGKGDGKVAAGGVRILAINVNDPVTPVVSDQPVALASAKNETVSFAIQLTNLNRPGGEGRGGRERAVPILRMQALRLGAGTAAEDRIEPAQYTAYQLLQMPVDLNRAGYVRHTGLEVASSKRLPRALLPVAVNKGQVNLAALRDPSQPRNPQGRATSSAEPAMLWVDVNVPVTARPGDYQTTFEVLENAAVVSTLVVNLRVNDFALPDDRHLLMVGRLEWDSLRRLYPAAFEAVRPELMSRTDPRYAPGVRILDQIVTLGQQNRLEVVVPALQPQVKWPAGAPPRVSWADFDSVALPWLDGSAFADHVPLGYWPLPPTERLESFNAPARAMYWSAVASHFDQFNLLPHSSIVVEKTFPGPVTARDSLRLSEEAAQILAVHPRVRVSVPLEEDQVQFAGAGNPKLIDTKDGPRLVTAAPGLVFGASQGNWPKDVASAARWLRTDSPGLVPYVGAGGDERDVRIWAWLAFLRRAELIQWPNTLPNYDSPDQPADPNEITWFYPGYWFGVDEPVPSVQLKWMRRAQQDYEYLYLAKQRGEIIRSLVMARLITKPVEIPLIQVPDPANALMTGTTDPKAWEDVKTLLSESILLRPPGQQPDPAAAIDLNGRTLQWAVPQEKPLLMGRSTQWGWSANQQNGLWVDFRLGLDVYNAEDQRLIGALRWSDAPPAWQFDPQPVVIPPNLAVGVFRIQRFNMDARINLERVTAQSRQPGDLVFTNDLTNRDALLRVVAPVAISDRRGAGPLKLDGSLEDWSAADAIQDAPLVRMLNRPAVQKQELQYAGTPTQVYTAWTPTDLYVAFKVGGTQFVSSGIETNFIDYQFRRAWGEDLCEMVVQAVYSDGTVGPIVHLVCKPRGQLFAERKVDPRANVTPWQAVVGEPIRYAATTEVKDGNPYWRGELAIPWRAVNDARHQGTRPTLLRYNFAQHKNLTGESASWAGPVDSGRDEELTGLLYLRDPANPGAGRPNGGD